MEAALLVETGLACEACGLVEGVTGFVLDFDVAPATGEVGSADARDSRSTSRPTCSASGSSSMSRRYSGCTGWRFAEGCSVGGAGGWKWRMSDVELEEPPLSCPPSDEEVEGNECMAVKRQFLRGALEAKARGVFLREGSAGGGPGVRSESNVGLLSGACLPERPRSPARLYGSGAWSAAGEDSDVPAAAGAADDGDEDGGVAADVAVVGLKSSSSKELLEKERRRDSRSKAEFSSATALRSWTNSVASWERIWGWEHRGDNTLARDGLIGHQVGILHVCLQRNACGLHTQREDSLASFPCFELASKSQTDLGFKPG